MALQVDYKKSIEGFSSEITEPGVYAKVEKISGDKNNIEITLFLLKNDTILDGIFYSFKPVLEGDNFIKQAYTHLKTLPEFADATDV